MRALSLLVLVQGAMVSRACENPSQFQVLSQYGRQCSDVSNLIPLGNGSVTLNDCVEAVQSESACSEVFTFTPSDSSENCQCVAAAGKTCTVLDSYPSRDKRVFMVANSTFCECSEEVPEGDDMAIYGGDNCEEEFTENQEFIALLNGLTTVVNTGEALVQAEILAQSDTPSVSFNVLSVVHPAVPLERGNDAEILVHVQASGVDDDGEWLDVLAEGMLRALEERGHSLESNRLRVLGYEMISGSGSDDETNVEETSGSDATATTMAPTTTTTTQLQCFCPPVTYPSWDCGGVCEEFEVGFLIHESRVFEQWELGLIIAACVIFVCAMAVALSAVKSKHADDDAVAEEKASKKESA